MDEWTPQSEHTQNRSENAHHKHTHTYLEVLRKKTALALERKIPSSVECSPLALIRCQSLDGMILIPIAACCSPDTCRRSFASASAGSCCERASPAASPGTC